jgi:2-dehydro-3-deoxygluconokinase
MKSTVVTFGEILVRLDSPDNFRFSQTYPGLIRTGFAGSEANVAAAIALLGGNSRFITALPKSPISDACVSFLKGNRIDTDYIIFTDEGRLGIYFVETGANQLSSNVVYDRDWSSISLTEPENYRWKDSFVDAAWFHVSGISPALSEKAAVSAVCAVKEAKAAGLTVSCDINFRKKLWKWKPGVDPQHLAQDLMSEIIRNIDVLIGNEEDAELVLGIKAGKSDVKAGYLDTAAYSELCGKIAGKYPNLSYIAFTLRESISATYNRWGGMLFDVKADKPFFAPQKDGKYRPYEITSIIDRVGAGDSFAGALIHALCIPEQPDKALNFAAAASCLAHSIRGDFNYVTKNEILNLVNGSGSGRVNR